QRRGDLPAQKKPKGQDLSLADQWLNSIISTARIVVEHTIAGVKRCRIVKDVFRNTKPGFSDMVMEVACALHNLRVEFVIPNPLSSYSIWMANAYYR
ncbi:MAG: hypothetical protein HYR94_02300, partial [Chloroflexi bacterium]|nr:hypothetical protein [Chloroflexota bacterium]